MDAPDLAHKETKMQILQILHVVNFTCNIEELFLVMTVNNYHYHSHSVVRNIHLHWLGMNTKTITEQTIQPSSQAVYQVKKTSTLFTSWGGRSVTPC